MKKMIAGHLRNIKGTYHMVLSYKDEHGVKKNPSFTTKLKATVENKERATEMLNTLRKTFIIPKSSEYTPRKNIKEMTFDEYMVQWLEVIRTNLQKSTYASYKSIIHQKIVPHFKPKKILITELTGYDIQLYYDYALNVEKVSPNTVLRRHANIHAALERLRKLQIIANNPSDFTDKPKKKSFFGSIYNTTLLKLLFSAVEDTALELPVAAACYYGLRRSEIAGIREDSIDFDGNTFIIKHTVTEVWLDGERVLIKKDLAKNDSSYRTYPLIPPMEKVFKKIIAHNKEQELICKDKYYQGDKGYLFVDELGHLYWPHIITNRFRRILKKYELPKIRFHDLRHTCATLLLSQNVNMKDIQEWLGHESITTTEKFYAHYDISFKHRSAEAIQNIISN